MQLLYFEALFSGYNYFNIISCFTAVSFTSLWVLANRWYRLNADDVIKWPSQLG